MVTKVNKHIITIDTGTTNTRIVLWNSDRQLLDSYTAEVGVRDTAVDKSNLRLKNAVKEGLIYLLKNNALEYDNIAKIVASGMITSNVGLVEIPHLTAPVGLCELSAGAKEILLQEICPVPITFIPGVKNNVGEINATTFEQMDIMRGEEVETIALMSFCKESANSVFVLPGSHTKFVKVNGENKISACLTTLSGELLSSITHDTIIADTVNNSFVTEENYDKDMLLLGYNTSVATGMSRAVFSVRVLNQFCISDMGSLASYLLGAVLQSDIAALKSSSALSLNGSERIVVSGKNPFRQALIDLFYHDAYFSEINEIIPIRDKPLSGLGALMVME